MEGFIEWIDGFVEFTNDLSVSLQELIDSLQSFIQFSTYYIYGSGLLLIILFFMVFFQSLKLSRLERKIDALCSICSQDAGGNE